MLVCCGSVMYKTRCCYFTISRHGASLFLIVFYFNWPLNMNSHQNSKCMLEFVSCTGFQLK